MLLHTISFLILLVSLLIYFKLAYKYNIIDKPNERNSHSISPLGAEEWFLPLQPSFGFYFMGLMSPISLDR